MEKSKVKKIEDEFFCRLSAKLEEIFPKTNQDNPEIPSKGNRSGAISLNAYANIIFKDVLDQALKIQKQEIKKIVEEKSYDYQMAIETTKENRFFNKGIRKLKREILKALKKG